MRTRWILAAALLAAGAAQAQTSRLTVIHQAAPDGITLPELISPLAVDDVDYPLESILTGDQGLVSLSVGVDAAGRVTGAQIVGSSGIARLDKQAGTIATTKWKFNPATRNGQPIPATARIDVAWKPPLRSADDVIATMMKVSLTGKVEPPREYRNSQASKPGDYPAASARLGEQGSVVLYVEVLANGTVGDVQIVDSSTHQRLDQAAIQRVKNADKFYPGTVDGKPITAWIYVNDMFLIKDFINPSFDPSKPFCHSIPMVGQSLVVTATRKSDSLIVPQWIKISADGSITDALVRSRDGWMHLTDALIGNMSAQSKFPPAGANRPPVCWIGLGVTVAPSK